MEACQLWTKDNKTIKGESWQPWSTISHCPCIFPFILDTSIKPWDCSRLLSLRQALPFPFSRSLLLNPLINKPRPQWCWYLLPNIYLQKKCISTAIPVSFSPAKIFQNQGMLNSVHDSFVFILNHHLHPVGPRSQSIMRVHPWSNNLNAVLSVYGNLWQKRVANHLATRSSQETSFPLRTIDEAPIANISPTNPTNPVHTTVRNLMIIFILQQCHLSATPLATSHILHYYFIHTTIIQ